MRRDHAYILAAFLIGLPAIALKIGHFHPEAANAVMGMCVFGLAIVGAAFLLTWGAELAELEMSPNIALILLALVAVLPEYAVDIYLAWTAGAWVQSAAEPTNNYQALALANMTGANRLLIGLGWPVIAILAWRKFGRPMVRLDLARSSDLFWLGIATLYSFLLPIKGSITVFDTVMLLTLYGLYLWTASKVPSRDSHLVGPAATVAELPRKPRVVWTWVFFLWAAAVIFVSSEPFAESLIAGGASLGIDEFFLVQWLAPLASESPEFLAVILLALKGNDADAMGALVSSKVNQWSLLVGMVPLAFALGHLNTHGVWQGGFELDARQTEELVLTSAQSFFALATIMSYRFRLGDALLLLALFLVQLVGTILIEELGHHDWVTPWHYINAGLYMVLGTIHVVEYWRFVPAIYRGAIHLDEETWLVAMRGDVEIADEVEEVEELAAEGPMHVPVESSPAEESAPPAP